MRLFSLNRPLPILVFYDNLSEMLSVICIDFDCVIVTGDLNIHVDNLEDRETKELYCVFENYGLTQHVTGPTHIKGHTLDLIVSRSFKYSQGCSDRCCSI